MDVGVGRQLGSLELEGNVPCFFFFFSFLFPWGFPGAYW